MKTPTRIPAHTIADEAFDQARYAAAAVGISEAAVYVSGFNPEDTDTRITEFIVRAADDISDLYALRESLSAIAVDTPPLYGATIAALDDVADIVRDLVIGRQPTIPNEWVQLLQLHRQVRDRETRPLIDQEN